MSTESKETHRIFQFENEHVKVWKTVVMPNNLSLCIVTNVTALLSVLKGGTLKKVESTGEESPLVFETDKAYWLGKDDPGTLHGDINESAHPIEIMVIEVKSTSSSK